ncbi:PLP-dependent transferase [Atractiella rhizophila]|nr:PLP-dependent transferase [Atractiella rhizophila]
MDDPAGFNKALSSLLSIVSEHRQSITSLPIIPPSLPSTHGIPTALPEDPQGLEATLSLLKDEIIPRLGTWNGPRFFGFVTGGVTDAALLADMLTPSLDKSVQLNLPTDSLPILIEALTLHFVLSLLAPSSSPTLLQERFPGRTLTTGATASNVLGLTCGRDWTLRQFGVDVAVEGYSGRKVIVLHAGAHASVKKAAALVGIGKGNCLDFGGGGGREWDFDFGRLEERLEEAKESKEGVIVVAQMGEVNTGGMTSELPKIRNLCDKYTAWLHIDGAFGAFAALIPSNFPTVSTDLALGDSITMDGHKWLNVPYDCGLFYCRSASLQTGTFSINASYLSTGKRTHDIDAPLIDPLPPLQDMMDSIESPLNLGIENSRRFRALPLFASLFSLGRSGYTELISRNVSFARQIVSWLKGQEAYEVLLPDDMQVLNVVLFKSKRGKSGEMVRLINASGKMFVTPTKWRGEDAARLAVSNWMTGLDHGKGEAEDWEIVQQVLEQVAMELK